MAKHRQLSVEAPLAGLNRLSSYQRQSPFSSPDLLNVRAIGTLEGRERLGSRPGLVESHIDDLGGEVRMLAGMTLALGDGFTAWSDTFSGESMADAWSLPSWSESLPQIIPYSVASIDTSVAEGEAVLDALDIDTTESYTVEAYLVPWAAAWHGSYRLYLRLDNTTPAIGTAGVLIEITQTGITGTYAASLKSYTGGSETEVDTAAGSDSSLSPAWLSATVSGTTVTVYWNGATILTGTVDAHSGSRVGFGLSCSVDGGVCLANTFRVQYYSTGSYPATRSLLVASADGDIFYESTYGRMSQLTTDLTVRDDVLLQAAQSGQKLYIADYGDLRVTQTDGLISGDQLTATVNPTWTGLGILTNDDVVVISNVGGSTTASTYAISSVAAGAVTLASAPGDGTCSFRIERAPKVYYPADDTFVIMAATAGQVPTGCPLICRYLDRIVLAGAEIAPHAWYMARVGDELDWDYAEEDSQRAVAGTASVAGVPGTPITALIPHSDDYLIIACRNSLWKLLGDPAYDGGLNALSHSIGVIGRDAWCHVPSGELVFLSLDGLYVVSASGADATPIRLSREVLPREFLNINPDITTASLEYDIQAGGIHIFLTSASSNDRKHWWLDWGRKSFWPVTMDSDFEPTATCTLQATAIEDSAVILGGRDGMLRRFCDLAENDCGETFETYAVIGPVKLASDGVDGILRTVDIDIAESSGDVDWEITCGRTYEAAISNDASDSGSIVAGLNATVHPVCRGQAFSLKLSGAEARKWAVENIVTSARPSGRRRIL